MKKNSFNRYLLKFFTCVISISLILTTIGFQHRIVLANVNDQENSNKKEQGRIVFLQDNDIIVMNIDGTDRELITKIKDVNHPPDFSWSYDTEWLRIKVDKKLLIYNVLSKVLTTLEENSELPYYFDYFWAPDSIKFAYKYDDCINIYDVVSAKNSVLVCDVEEFNWGNQSDKIYFFRSNKYNRQGALINDLYEITLETKSERLLKKYDDFAYPMGKLSISPDGNYILFPCCGIGEGFGDSIFQYYGRGYEFLNINDPSLHKEISLANNCEWQEEKTTVCYNYDTVQILDVSSSNKSQISIKIDENSEINLTHIANDKNSVYGTFGQSRDNLDVVEVDKTGNLKTITDGELLDVSPSGEYFIINDNGILKGFNIISKEIYNLGGVTAIYNSYYFAVGWTSPKSVPNINPLIERKQIAINNIETPSYEWLLGLEDGTYIPKMDEAEAKKLILDLKNEVIEIDEEKYKAFERFVLQEETIGVIQRNFESVSNDEGEAWGGMVAMILSFVQFVRKYIKFLRFFPEQDLVQKTIFSAIEHSIKLLNRYIQDPNDLEAYNNLTDFIFMLLSSGGSIAEIGYFDLLPETVTRLIFAISNHKKFNEAIQPTIDKGVNSVYGESPNWLVTREVEFANSSMEYLEKTSENFSNVAHENFEDNKAGLDFLTIVSDVSELVKTSGIAAIPALIIEITTKIEFLLLNFWQLFEFILPAKHCNIALGEAAGEQAFNPDASTIPDCSFPASGRQNLTILPSTSSVDSIAWNNFKENHLELLGEYQNHVEKIRSSTMDEDEISKSQYQKIFNLVVELNNSIEQGFTLIAPSDNEVLDEQTVLVVQAFIQLELSTIKTLMATELTKEELGSSEVQKIISDSYDSTIDVIEINNEVMEEVAFRGDPIGVGIVFVEEPIFARPNQEVIIPITFKNIGGGTLDPGSLEVFLINSKNKIKFKTPLIESGMEYRTDISFQAPKKLPEFLRITFQVDNKKSTVRVPVNAQTEQSINNSNEQFKPIVGILIILSGFLFIIIGVLVYIRNRNKKVSKIS